jgi:hypothetical protein
VASNFCSNWHIAGSQLLKTLLHEVLAAVSAIYFFLPVAGIVCIISAFQPIFFPNFSIGHCSFCKVTTCFPQFGSALFLSLSSRNFARISQKSHKKTKPVKRSYFTW